MALFRFPMASLVYIVAACLVVRLYAVPNFDQGIKLSTVTSGQIDEASGLAASRTHPGVLYTINDHGDGPYIYVLDSATGHRISTITLNNAQNGDWEDIAYGPCPGGSYCIYVGDTGDSTSRNTLYMVREPANIQQDQDVDVFKTLKFSWTEADCETLMVDPQGEVYIVSKIKGQAAKAAHVPSGGWNSGTTIALTNIVTLGFHTANNDPTGGDLSPDGREILLVSHHKMFYYNVTNGDVLATLQGTPAEVSYIDEPQGEAVTWDPKGQGYYTLSEGHHQPIYYYSRL